MSEDIGAVGSGENSGAGASLRPDRSSSRASRRAATPNYKRSYDAAKLVYDGGKNEGVKGNKAPKVP